jgi:ammonium transporter, Amt family
MLESGAVTPKNAKHILYKNVVDSAIGIVMWWLIGWPVAFGDLSEETRTGFWGIGDYVTYNPDSYANYKWYFQGVFCVTSVTITSGGLAERCYANVYFLYAAIVTGIIYPTVAHWIWSPNGWLSAFNTTTLNSAFDVGVIDYAGGGVVHMQGGIAAIIGAWLLGYRNQYTTEPTRFLPRFQFTAAKKWVVNEWPVNSIALMAIGVLILFFGFFGFNCGSTLAMSTTASQYVAGLIAINTILSASSATLVLVIMSPWIHGHRRNMLNDALNGTLAGLVTITSPCAVIEPWAAFTIGVVGGILYKLGSLAVLKMRIDDPLDAFAVHYVCGLWSLISVGLFATKRLLPLSYAPADGRVQHGGLFIHGDPWILGMNLFGAFMITVWAGGFSLIYFGICKAVNWFRIPAKEEENGVDNDVHDAMHAALVELGALPRGDAISDMGARPGDRYREALTAKVKAADEAVKITPEQLQILNVLSQEGNANVLGKLLYKAKTGKTEAGGETTEAAKKVWNYDVSNTKAGAGGKPGAGKASKKDESSSEETSSEEEEETSSEEEETSSEEEETSEEESSDDDDGDVKLSISASEETDDSDEYTYESSSEVETPPQKGKAAPAKADSKAAPAKADAKAAAKKQQAESEEESTEYEYETESSEEEDETDETEETEESSDE